MLSLIRKFKHKRKAKILARQVFSCLDLLREISSHLNFYTWWAFRCVSHNTFIATKNEYETICARTLYADLAFRGWSLEDGQYRLYVPRNVVKAGKNIGHYYVCACNGCRNAEKLLQRNNKKSSHCVCCDCFDCVCPLKHKKRLYSLVPSSCYPSNCSKKPLNNQSWIYPQESSDDYYWPKSRFGGYDSYPPKTHFKGYYDERYDD